MELILLLNETVFSSDINRCYYFFYIKNQGKYFINISRSMPYGIYKVVGGKINRGDLVLVYLDGKRKKEVEFFTGKSKPLLKRVVGLRKDRFFIKDNKVYLNDFFKGVVLDKNQSGFDLPKLKMCRKLNDNEVVVLGENKDSYDSRYFGLVEIKDLSKVKIVL